MAGTGTKPHQRDLALELTHLLGQRLWLKAKLMLQAVMEA